MILDTEHWPTCKSCGEKFNSDAAWMLECEDCYRPRGTMGIIGGINNRAFATDEACNGGWSNVVREYEDCG